MLERLQKILSARGICSRRKAEEYLRQGLVKVNGRTALLGQKANPAVDRIEVDGRVLEERREMLYYVMNKPVGVVVSNVERGVKGSNRSKALKAPLFEPEPQSRRQAQMGRVRGGEGVRHFGGASRKQAPDSALPTPMKLRGTDRASSGRQDDTAVTVRDLLPKELQGKIYPVGRLDKDSSGLLLFTNDGVLAYRLTHPKFDHEKEYEVEMDRSMPDRVLRKLAAGVYLGGERTKTARFVRLSATRFSLTLTEGRNRQIRRMCQQLGYTVKALARTRVVTLRDPKLREGQLRTLTPRERADLLSQIGFP